jgi:hypothetical protein
MDKSEDSMSLFDRMQKAFGAKGRIIGRTTDGKEVYGHGDEDDDEQAVDNSKEAGDQDQQAAPPAPPQKKGPPTPQQAPQGVPDATDDDEDEEGEGTHDHHAQQALAHLQAAQAHASAAHSAKKVDEAKEHKKVVREAKEMSQATAVAQEPEQQPQQNGALPSDPNGDRPTVPQPDGNGDEQEEDGDNKKKPPFTKSFRKNNLHITTGTDDELVELLEKGGVIGTQAAGIREDARQRLRGLRRPRRREDVLRKGVVFEGELDAHGSRGGDMRETVARAQVEQDVVVMDDNNAGNGGMADWFSKRWEKLTNEQVSKARAPVGGVGRVASGMDEAVSVVDDSTPYGRIVAAGGHPAEHQSSARLLYQGKGRELPK